METENRGGKRKGSGPKPKYTESTKVVSFRVPESKAQELRSIVQEFLDKLKKTE